MGRRAARPRPGGAVSPGPDARALLHGRPVRRVAGTDAGDGRRRRHDPGRARRRPRRGGRSDPLGRERVRHPRLGHGLARRRAHPHPRRARASASAGWRPPRSGRGSPATCTTRPATRSTSSSSRPALGRLLAGPRSRRRPRRDRDDRGGRARDRRRDRPDRARAARGRHDGRRSSRRPGSPRSRRSSSAPRPRAWTSTVDVRGDRPRRCRAGVDRAALPDPAGGAHERRPSRRRRAATWKSRSARARSSSPSRTRSAPRPLDARGDGHGLIGMRERAALLGGDGSRPALRDGRFSVHAELPYAAGTAMTPARPRRSSSTTTT